MFWINININIVLSPKVYAKYKKIDKYKQLLKNGKLYKSLFFKKER